jgi:hypothetical protein
MGAGADCLRKGNGANDGFEFLARDTAGTEQDWLRAD